MRTARMAFANAAVTFAVVALAAACSNGQFAATGARTATTPASGTPGSPTAAPGSTTPSGTDPANSQPGSANATPGVAGTTPGSGGTPGIAGTTPGAGPGSGTGTGTAPGTGTDPGVSSGGDASCNLSGDFVKLQFPASIQSCIDQGKIYDFSTQTCFTNVSQATSFPCTFDGVEKAVGQPLLADQHPGAKLVGCGERRQGQTIVLQWWVPPPGATSCSYSPSWTIGTECFAKNVKTDLSKIDPNTAAGVAACANAD